MYLAQHNVTQSHIITFECDTICEIIMGTDQNFDFMQINYNNNISDTFFTCWVW